VSVALVNAKDSTGAIGNIVGPQMGVLIGDTTGDGVVNTADITQTRRQSGNMAHDNPNANFREDVTMDGVINTADITAVRKQSGAPSLIERKSRTAGRPTSNTQRKKPTLLVLPH